MRTYLDRLQAAGEADAGDWFGYVIGEAVADLEGAPYGGARHPVEARLDGRPFAKFHLDVGLGDIQREPVEWVESRDWLGFAGVAPGRFPSISREEHFAQKLHAYTMPRGDRPNSRVKDLVDLVLLIEASRLDRERLARDVADTFRRRGTHVLPDRLELPAAFWEPIFDKLAPECGIVGGIGERFAQVERFCAESLEWAQEGGSAAGPQRSYDAQSDCPLIHRGRGVPRLPRPVRRTAQGRGGGHREEQQPRPRECSGPRATCGCACEAGGNRPSQAIPTLRSGVPEGEACPDGAGIAS